VSIGEQQVPLEPVQFIRPTQSVVLAKSYQAAREGIVVSKISVASQDRGGPGKLSIHPDGIAQIPVTEYLAENWRFWKRRETFRAAARR
jgi:hypothetical protein